LTRAGTSAGCIVFNTMSSSQDDIPLTPQISPRTQPLIDYSSSSLSPNTTRASANASKQAEANTMKDAKSVVVDVSSTGAWSREIDAQTDEPPCTTTTLQNFSRVRERNKKRSVIKNNDPGFKEDQEVAPLLKQLRDWKNSQDTGPFSWFTSKRYPRPSDDSLERLALHYFPLRGDLRVRVIDFKNGKSQQHEARTLGELADC
jgi:hypothetical protein